MTHMERVGIREMRQSLSRDAQRARRGESFIITDRATEVAQLGPAPARATPIDSLVALLPLDDATVEAAAGLEPATPRALDAMHLATAASLGADLGRFSCYDVRPAGAASAAEPNVRTPG
jgi:antitoxin (DNA-binding transcriptional repressor) of toxin-antitoxin stability system